MTIPKSGFPVGHGWDRGITSWPTVWMMHQKRGWHVVLLNFLESVAWNEVISSFWSSKHSNSVLIDANCCPSPSWSQELSVNAWNARFWTQKTRKFKPKVNNEQLSSWRRVKSEVNQLSSSLPVRNTSLYQLHDVSSPDDASFDWFICGQVGWWIIWDFRREYVLDRARSFEARYVSCIGMWIHSQIWNLTMRPISADTFTWSSCDM